MITQVQHLFQRGRRHRTRVLPTDLNLPRCQTLTIGLEIQPQIFVLVVGAEPGRHAAILAQHLDQTDRGTPLGRSVPRPLVHNPWQAWGIGSELRGHDRTFVRNDVLHTTVPEPRPTRCVSGPADPAQTRAHLSRTQLCAPDP